MAAMYKPGVVGLQFSCDSDVFGRCFRDEHLRLDDARQSELTGVVCRSIGSRWFVKVMD